ncbi:C4-dicarboxylate-specific signal transduction histidine kinase [Paenibacillus sp. V4I3]|uniref:hypothetical protein n=1 Tax=Paenibacillus sp. V4I3 TaxID=3042305 RepID=UPI00278947F8|nr:hypothetical protein [Paenibacillus sp. V4I3]MDQ0877723.1 C4-dicarboxylate-specific signal transduction histidine kinase [Paenibacillus sp. V4I3]
MINRQPFSIRNTIFLRLLSTFLLIMLPIILFGVYLYHWIVQTASEDISKTAVSQLTFYITDLEKEVERMKLLQYGVIEDEDLNELTLTWDTMDVFKRTEKINSLRKRLYAIQNSSPYIKNVSAHIYLLSKTISSAYGPSEFNTERYNGFRSELSSRNNQIVEWKGGLFLSAAKQSVTNGNQPLFIIEIELDQERLQEALSQFNTYPGSGTLLTTNKSGVILTSGSLKHLEQDVTATIEQIRETPLQSTETFTISGNRYYTAIASSGYLSMSIYRFIPEQMIKKPLDKFYIWAWLFILVAFSSLRFMLSPLINLFTNRC